MLRGGDSFAFPDNLAGLKLDWRLEAVGDHGEIA